jgi:hypothetical protein
MHTICESYFCVLLRVNEVIGRQALCVKNDLTIGLEYVRHQFTS